MTSRLWEVWSQVLADIRRHDPKPVVFAGQLRWSIGAMKTTGAEVLVDTVEGLPRWVLRSNHTGRPLDLYSLLHMVVQIAGVDRDEVLSGSRAKPVVAARRAFVIAARRDPTAKYSYPDISHVLGRTNHTMALGAHRRGWSDPLVAKIMSRIPSPWGTAVGVR